MLSPIMASYQPIDDTHTISDHDHLNSLKTIFSSSGVVQVNFAAESGNMGVLANHVPTIESLKPGVVEVIENQGDSKKWFGNYQFFHATISISDLFPLMFRFSIVSGGFANVHPNNTLTINAVEAFPLEAFSAEVCPFVEFIRS